MPNKSGFTLIEILVSIAIISLAGVIVLPNLSKFNTSQQIKNASSELKNSIKNASSKAASHIKCNETTSSTAWSVIVYKESPIRYELKATCDTLPPTQVLNFKSSLTGNAAISSPNCGSSFPATLTFQPNAPFSYSCNNAAAIQGDFTMTLKDNNDSSQSITITISKGGIISEQ